MSTQVLYVHCWGGHGRAGSVVCLLLHRLYGLDAASALFRCQFVHDCRRLPIVVGSPQTTAQRDQVARVIGALIAEDRAAAARAAADAARHLREDAVVAADAVEELAADGLALEDFDEAGAPEADGRPPRSFGGAPRRPGPQRAGARPASRLGPIAGRRASLEVEDVAGDGGRACLDVRT